MQLTMNKLKLALAVQLALVPAFVKADTNSTAETAVETISVRGQYTVNETIDTATGLGLDTGPRAHLKSRLDDRSPANRLNLLGPLAEAGVTPVTASAAPIRIVARVFMVVLPQRGDTEPKVVNRG